MTRDDTLDDGLAKSLFSGISRPRSGCLESENKKASPSEVQSSSDVVQTSVFVFQMKG